MGGGVRAAVAATTSGGFRQIRWIPADPLDPLACPKVGFRSKRSSKSRVKKPLRACYQEIWTFWDKKKPAGMLPGNPYFSEKKKTAGMLAGNQVFL